MCMTTKNNDAAMSHCKTPRDPEINWRTVPTAEIICKAQGARRNNVQVSEEKLLGGRSTMPCGNTARGAEIPANTVQYMPLPLSTICAATSEKSRTRIDLRSRVYPITSKNLEFFHKPSSSWRRICIHCRTKHCATPRRTATAESPQFSSPVTVA